MRGTDDAIWNRSRLIPFEVTIAPDEMDRELPLKLLTEAEGILAWAIAGAQCWYREGLGAASELDGARHAWRMESDPIGRFLEECCTTGAGRAIAARELYLAYGAWAEAAGEPVITVSAFGRRLTALGFRRRRREPRIPMASAAKATRRAQSPRRLGDEGKLKRITRRAGPNRARRMRSRKVLAGEMSGDSDGPKTVRIRQQ